MELGELFFFFLDLFFFITLLWCHLFLGHGSITCSGVVSGGGMSGVLGGGVAKSESGKIGVVVNFFFCWS